ncbi:MAG: hypothetical protein A3H79_02915 [Candidatus Levybacteria bacterium RIFCSPLOWO2_02_FULL_36_8b]|nr:MAG: hypothetical protein A3H79_02915 [Candidatus Levybacteria bacterium RIFCSPLOWO2_02_FULL_36_8b]
MPGKNIVKVYIEGGYYHIYNRGIDKRNIFLDEQDCKVFLHYLKIYLSPKEELLKLSQTNIKILRYIKFNLHDEIDLMSFTLMPNHFHLQVKQYTKEGIIKLTRRVVTSYVMYFNDKYKRKGGLFESIYKAALIDNDSYLLHLSRYIHLNCRELLSHKINFQEFSSYHYYLGKKQASWLKPQEILKYFKTAKNRFKNIFSYKSFVEDYLDDSGLILGSLTLEED